MAVKLQDGCNPEEDAVVEGGDRHVVRHHCQVRGGHQGGRQKSRAGDKLKKDFKAGKIAVQYF